LYLFYAGMAIGFLAVFISLVIAGVMYFLSAASAEARAQARDRFSGAISGLLILVLTYLIITTINPELRIFRIKELPKVEEPTEEKKENPGVDLYGSNNCEASTTDSSKFMIAINQTLTDLADWKNRINSAKIVQGDKVSYVVSLYENPGLWGKCLYLDPNKSGQCQPAVSPKTGRPFASSVSVYAYDFEPNGDGGVYFYRKSYFNEGGGYLKIDNNEINGFYMHDLNDLRFQNVPREEQDCIKYDDKGECTNRRPQSLAGENISSIKIKGDYLVILSYAGPGQTCEDAFNDSCQEFPTPDDVNKAGPQQLKWEAIRNSGGIVPNCVTIIPIQY